jgi:hypothetical protein
MSLRYRNMSLRRNGMSLHYSNMLLRHTNLSLRGACIFEPSAAHQPCEGLADQARPSALTLAIL